MVIVITGLLGWYFGWWWVLVVMLGIVVGFRLIMEFRGLWGRVSGVDLGCDVEIRFIRWLFKIYSCLVWVCVGVVVIVCFVWGWVICINRALVCFGL